MHGKLVSILLKLKNDVRSRAITDLNIENPDRLADLMLCFDASVYTYSILRIFESIFIALNKISPPTHNATVFFRHPKSLSSLMNFLASGSRIDNDKVLQKMGVSSDLYPFFNWIHAHYLRLPFCASRASEILCCLSDSESSLMESTNETIQEMIRNAKISIQESDLVDQNGLMLLSPDFFEEYFENTLDFAKKKGSGSIYTPKPIANYIINRLLEEKIKNAKNKSKSDVINEIMRLRVLDPCCGCGCFVIAYLHAIKTYIETMPTTEIKKSDYFKNILQNSLYAFDLNDYALSITKLRLIVFYYSIAIETDENTKDSIDPSLFMISHIQRKNALIYIRETDTPFKFFSGFEKFPITLSEELGSDPQISAILKNLELNSIEVTSMKGTRIDPDSPFLNDLSQSLKQLQCKHEVVSLNLPLNESTLPLLFPLYEKEIDGKFDLIFGNPPYVRADNQDLEYKSLRKLIKHLNKEDVRISKCFKMKWDLYLAFLSICSIELLKKQGHLGFIISDSFGYSEFSEPLRQYFLSDYRIYELAHFSSNKVFTGANVRPMILFLEKSMPIPDSQTIIHLFQDSTLKLIRTSRVNQNQADVRSMFRGIESNCPIIFDSKFEMDALDNICYLSVGIVANAHEVFAKSEFRKSDLIFESPNEHCKKYLEGKDLEAYKIRTYRYIEWGTARSPAKLRRPTFPELFIGKKILMGTMAAGTLELEEAIVNHSIVVIRLWIDLKNVYNHSIRLKHRDSLEKLSQKYSYEYLLAILNSDLIRTFLNSIRVSSITNHIQPNDYRKVPIPRLENQIAYIILVQLLIRLKGSRTPTQNETKAIETIISILNAAVYELYYSKTHGTAFNVLLIEIFKKIENNEKNSQYEPNFTQIMAIIESIKIPQFN